MTCIVGFVKQDKVYMGGDSAGVAGLDVTLRKDTKVFNVDNRFLIGYTSSFRMGQLLRFKLKVPKQKTNQDDYQYMCTTFIDAVRSMLKSNGYSRVDLNTETIGVFLVGYKGNLYRVERDLQVGQGFDDFDSIGCGRDYALGAIETLRKNTKLSPMKLIEESLNAATKFSGGVRPPFNIEVL